MNIEEQPFTPYHKGYNSRSLPRPFVAWDGEGITETEGQRQNYVLFGNSYGFSVQSNRLTTEECLRLIIDTERAHTRHEKIRAIHVGFSFSYDVEMILCDLPRDRMRILKRKGYVTWRSYRIEYKRQKWFQVTLLTLNPKEKVTAKIWDVWSFFSTSFIKAIEEFLGDVPLLDEIREGKAARSTFRFDQVEELIKPYWKLELTYTVEMMNSLRDRLITAELPIKQWHGPGAIASYAMTKYKVQDLLDREIPTPVSDASQYAFAGGRFELFGMGRANAKVYSYDIRSAYPSAIQHLPDLRNGEWSYVSSPDRISHFGVYHIRYRHSRVFTLRPMPLYWRDRRHAIHYPNIVEGWYWSPEAEICQTMLGPEAEIIEGYEFTDSGTRPFSWIQDVYDTRAEWKRNNNPAQIALKLLLNSMYGKFAQRVGWERTGTAPKWHQLEYAGWITSSARARIFRAMVQAWSTESLIGVETDGIFTTKPLTLDIGPGLGQWEETVYDDMIYLQSGFYHKLLDGEWTHKTRGFDKGTVTVDKTLAIIEDWKPWKGHKGILEGQTTRFPTMGQWLTSKNDIRNVWRTTPRSLALGNDGKRVHRPGVCRACKDRIPLSQGLHDLTITYPQGGMSRKHILPWITTETNPFREYEEFDYHA